MQRSPVLLLCALLSCSPPPPADPDLSCDGTSSATLAAGAQQVLTAKCASCHIAGYTFGDYTSATKSAVIVGQKSQYAAMPGTLKVVDPGNLANSALWLKVLGGATRGRSGPKGENVFGVMPNDGTKLTSAEQLTLKNWICSGAN